jgi:HAD superfamily hydrolase (TIGR01509 family)
MAKQAATELNNGNLLPFHSAGFPVASSLVKAVIFDFSGTLFRCAQPQTWLTDTLADAGLDATDDQIAYYAARLHDSGGQPGGHGGDIPLPDRLRPLWARRDLDPPAHQAVYTELMRLAELPWPGIEDLLYERHWHPRTWVPYPDTRQALEILRDRGIPVAVLSNIPRDVRPIFRYQGLDALVLHYLFSYEEGLQKPDPEIFRRACGLLGHKPADVLMIGDSVSADGAATTIGCQFRAVAHLPVDQRPDALLAAIRTPPVT